MESTGFDLSVQQRTLLQPAAGRLPATRAVIEISGTVDAAALRSALATLVERYEILRTRFRTPEGLRVPMQVVDPDATVEWSQPAEAPALEPFANSSDDGLRAYIAKGNADPARDLLVLTAPAAIADAASLTAVGLAALAACGGAPDADTEPLQYADFAAWQQEMLGAGDASVLAAESHWRREGAGDPVRLSGEPPVVEELPLTDAARTAVAEMAASLGADVADVWCAAAASVVARLHAQSDTSEVVVAVTVDGRQDAELSGAIGPYTIAAPIRLAETTTPFADQVRRVTASRSGAAQHALRPAATAASAAVAVVSFDELPAESTAGSLGMRVVDRLDSPAPTNLRVAIVDDGSQAHATIVGDRNEVAALVRHLPPFLEALRAAAASTPVDVLPLWSDADRQAELSASATPSARDLDVKSFHELVARAAARNSARTAVVAGDATLTYGELETRSNRLANALRAQGATRNVPVALLLDRRADLVVALLGVLKAGAAYLPLHADHPAERLSFQMSDSGARIVVTVNALLEQVPADSEVVVLDDGTLESQADAAPDNVTEPADLAYVIYTSGSTGQPKGVGVTHANLLAYTPAARDRLLGGQADGLDVAIVTSVSTDLGNTAIVLALAGGGALHVVPAEVAVDAVAYAQWSEQHPVDVLKITPSHLRALLAGGAGVLPRKLLVVGGEALPWELVRQVEALGTCAIANHYGPTETTIGALTYAVARGEQRDDSATVPIGVPLPGYRAYVLDPHGAPVPHGMTGELCIGGAGVARGYIGRDDLTAERFVADPLGGRMYRTGDLVRRLTDGSVEFLGRLDGQVKIRGYRVEPGEVEQVLEGHGTVRQAAVVPQPDPSGDLRLVAYVVGDVSTAADADALRVFVGDRLPSHMVPSLILPIESMPLTANGKLDRKALPDPATVRLSDESSYVAPRDEVEEKIAGVWMELLGLPQVGVEDDFFSLGGHSLLAAQVIARVLRDFGVQLPLHSLFVSPTVATLAAMVRAEMAGGDASLETLLGDIENMSDEEAARLLAGEPGPAEGA